ncbi:hypothetical protein ASZ78_004286 [Callipepla squamata]|uniref:E3 ubiquitin-protein ligase n=1 Tax=Callipepla squamata TaxID=9009 RepID=A0A226MRT4_CALSU|nr:hypothetical protein ASZ78_004286 [Callipepla squamata]
MWGQGDMWVEIRGQGSDQVDGSMKRQNQSTGDEGGAQELRQSIANLGDVELILFRHLEVVVSHLRQTHRINILQGAEIVFLATDMHLPAPTDWIIMHSCLGHQFLLVLRKQEKYKGHPQFFATMMLIGTQTQADNFTYRLELNRNQRRLKWEATPRSVLECIDSVISDGDCLVLNTSLAQLFADNGSLAIGIAITTSKVHNSEAEI